MIPLGNALAIALPLLASATGGGGGAAAASQAASSSKAESFISAGASAFLEAQGISGKPGDRRPFQKAAPTPRQNRPVTQLVRGNPLSTAGAQAPRAIDPVEFQMPLYRSVVENLQRTARNSQVRELLDRFAVVQPTKSVGQSEKVKMTGVNI
jgi:hypothetical protein|tara:strand:- start:9435 stop:9893 length:459 start_codon:yes stop_codon:yes gene_type:complete